MMNYFKEGELCAIKVIKKIFVRKLKADGVLHTNKGYIRHGDIIGLPEGSILKTNLNKTVYVYRPTLEDLIMSVTRKTAISYPKDIPYIVFSMGLHSGSKVLEAGTGSGALTIALSYYVMPEGKVVTYEKREGFVRQAESNILKAGLLDYVEIKNKDISKGVEETDFDCAVLDLPEPWRCLEVVFNALKPGKPLCMFLPTVNQTERLARELKRYGFSKPRTVEILQRTWNVKEGATRPNFKMYGHTCFLITTRKLSVEK